MSHKYSAFISYSHDDEAVAAWLQRKLEGYALPSGLRDGAKSLGAVFRDVADLGVASSLSDSLQQALTDSSSLIIVCSKAAQESRWVNEEIRFFRALGRGDRIFCLLIRGETLDCLPTALSEDADSPEPLAASLDLGRRVALRKLVAGIAGVDYDQLARREERKRVRRAASIATLSLLGSVLTGALALYALQQRSLAQAEADAANAVSRYLIGLFELANPMTENPDNISARTLLERGADKLDRELASQPEIKGRLLRSIGEVQINLGMLNEAKETLSRSLPLLPDGQPLEARALIALAEAEHRLSQLDQASETIGRVGRTLAEQEIDDPELIMRYHSEAAFVAYLRSETERALEHALIAEEIAGTLEDGAEHAKILNRLGAIYVNLERFEEAYRALRVSLAMQIEQLGEDHILVAMARHNLADKLALTDQFEEGLALERLAVPVFRRLLDPDHPRIATVEGTLGVLYVGIGDFSAALEHFNEALRIAEPRLGPEHGLVATTLTDRAQVLGRLGRKAESDRDFDRAEAAFASLMGPDHDFVVWVRLRRAELADQIGDRPAFEDACARARTVLDANPAITQEYRSMYAQVCDRV